MDDETDLLVLAASAWTELMEYRYCFTYGYRKQLYEICLSFSVQDFPHLAGFQYLKDIQLPKFNPPKTVEMILSGKIKFDTVKKSSQFDNLVKPRLLALVRLKDTLENNFGLYSFTPRFYPFTTTIKADYLISTLTGPIDFIFIIRAGSGTSAKAQEMTIGDFLCCSAFEMDVRDYRCNGLPGNRQSHKAHLLCVFVPHRRHLLFCFLRHIDKAESIEHCEDVGHTPNIAEGLRAVYHFSFNILQRQQH